MKINNAPRQSGKTLSLIDQLEWLNIFGYENIWVVTSSRAMEVYIRTKLLQRDTYNKKTKFIQHLTHTYGLEQPKYILVDEYNYCNTELIDHIKKYYSDRVTMWGTL